MERRPEQERSTLYISEAFEFLNDPQYGNKSTGDPDHTGSRIKKSVSDTGLVKGDNSKDHLKHQALLGKGNTYTIVTFVEADRSKQNTKVLKSYDPEITPINDSEYEDRSKADEFTIVTYVEKSSAKQTERNVTRMPEFVIPMIQGENSEMSDTPNYLPCSDQDSSNRQNNGDSMVINGNSESQMKYNFKNVLPPENPNKANTQQGEITTNCSMSQNGIAGSAEEIQSEKVHCDEIHQTESVSDQDGGCYDKSNDSQSGNDLLRDVTLIQNTSVDILQSELITHNVSKTIITVNQNVNTKPTADQRSTPDCRSDSKNDISQSDVVTSQNSSVDDHHETVSPEIETKTGDGHTEEVNTSEPNSEDVMSIPLTNLNDPKDLVVPGDVCDTSFSDDDVIVMRPPSPTLGKHVAPSRCTQKIVSDAFHFLKEIDEDIDEEDGNNLEDSVVIGDKPSSAISTSPKMQQPTLRRNSVGKLPPPPPLKPKRFSSSSQITDVMNNESSRPKPEEGTRSPRSKAVLRSKSSPGIKPVLAPKPKRNMSGCLSPTLPKESRQIPTPTATTGVQSADLTDPSGFNHECVSTDDKSEPIGPTHEDERLSSDRIEDSENGPICSSLQTENLTRSDPMPTEQLLSPTKTRPTLVRGEAIMEADVEGLDTLGWSGGLAMGGEEHLSLRRKKSQSRSSTHDEDSADSSDEDTGIYNESYRNSFWIQVSNDNISLQSANSLMSNTSESVDHDQSSPKKHVDGAPQESKGDDVFVEGTTSRPYERQHSRSDSITTTRSESEFKREYQFRRKCFVQRSDSQQEYHRLSAKFYDNERILVLQRPDLASDLGLHILDSHPAIITSADPESPAEKAGVKKGQILISVNQVNVLQSSHAEIISLFQECSHQVSLEVASSDLNLVRDLQSSTVSGFMHKVSNSMFVRTWKKRFFVLRKDNCLYYYKNDQDCGDPLGALPMMNYTMSKHMDSSKQYCFKAEKYGAKTYYFHVDSQDDMARWVCAMNEAALVSKKRKDSWMDITSHNVGLPALEIRRTECTGYLRKSNKAMKNWKKRYCVLKDACIYYYKHMNSHHARGMAHLHGYFVDVKDITDKPFSFVLRPPDTQMRTFFFIAENETDKLRWVETVRKSVQRWIKVD